MSPYRTNNPLRRDEIDGVAHVLDLVDGVLNRAPSNGDSFRPRITLTYAQSLDGCVSAEIGSQTQISNNACQVVTHRLRAAHDAILVGVTTVLIDNPRLNVRLVDGDDPTPVIVDSRLRTPLDAHVVQNVSARPVIFTTETASSIRAARLTDAGARVIRVASTANGRVDLAEAFRFLQEDGLKSVMIEGGARVITSILSGSFADQLVLTIAPIILGGVQAVEKMDHVSEELRPRLKNVSVQSIGGDLILHGEFGQPG